MVDIWDVSTKALRMKQIGLRWPEDLIERINKALPEGLSRSEFIRRCVLVALVAHEPEPVSSLEDSEKAYDRALAQPARADEPEPLVKSRVTVHTPKADIPPKVVPKIAGLKPASEIVPTALCRCGHTAIRHFNKAGACIACDKGVCRNFTPG